MEENEITTVEKAEAAAPAEETAEAKASARVSSGKAALLIAAAVAVIAILVGVVVQSSNSAEASAPEATSAAVETAAEPETEPATVPADTGADNVSFKGTYTAEDEAVLAAKDTVVATVGSNELTLGELQIFYWMEVRNFLNSYYYYASYIGLDYTQPLDTQPCMFSEEGYTWQQYFLGAALESWKNYSTMAAEADVRGIEMNDTMKQGLASMPENLAADAAQYGFEDADAMLRDSMGAAADTDGYIAFAERFYKANSLYASIAEQIDPTAEELEAFFEEHAEELGVTKEDRTVDVRHVLLFPEGADSATVNSQEWPEEAWAAAEAKAQELLQQWQDNDPTEESFAELANANSQDGGSNTNGGLYQGVTEGQMVQAFNDWCFDESRAAGDTGIVRTNYGYHIMYFVSSELSWEPVTRSAYISDKASAEATAISEKEPMKVNWSEILLSSVVL